MKILYGVVGEGMGHAMRSRVILEHLTSEGHDVAIMTSGRAVDYLSKRFEGVRSLHGLHMIYEENRVRPLATLWSNVLKGATGVPKNVAAYFKLIGEFKPDAVISDFDSWTYLYGKLHRLPVLSVDNMQIIDRCALPAEVIAGHESEFALTKAFIKGKLPWCDRYFITTFFRPPVRKTRTRLFPPILRQEILAAKRRNGAHLLVYTTGEGNEGIASTLQATGIECRVYGMRRGLSEEAVEGNLRYRPFDEPRFIDDLASCRAVIAGGGFTLMGEAVFLGKPMLSVPMGGQFEQVLNARYLQKEGYGMAAEKLDDPARIGEFLKRLPEFRKNLARHRQNGNRLIFRAIDAWLRTRASQGRRGPRGRRRALAA
ncbi:MAG TPA: MJ1255/VC2487 family glycosyltransferase [Candidatus Binatia bacterium]|jgi:uncharacterized protein (TIGR00661 family)|nr:MJ1255/VC2487 family glycosyltransferase [Candidatus Binatia bacterium]